MNKHEREREKELDFMALVCSVDIFSFMFFTHWRVLFEKAYSFVYSTLHCLFPWPRQISSVAVQLLHSFLADHFFSRYRGCQVPPSSIPWRNSFRRAMFLRIQNLFQRKLPRPVNPSPASPCSLFDYRCPVCLNQREASLQWIALGCGHLLCSLCTQQLYFGGKPLCPHCRSPIVLSDLTLLYL